MAAGGESTRLYVSSYHKPLVTGDPPVTNVANPGNESEGEDVELLV